MSLTGTVLGGRYRVGAMLGRGGMGAVYEAVQQGIDRVVALKVMHPHLAGDAQIRARFQREARVVATVRHPNVVQINDYVESPGEPSFLVMERLHGETLRDVTKRTPALPQERVVRIAVQMLSALDAAHRAGVVHRDIKPDNVFLQHTTAQADLVKLLDFGVAKLLGEEDEAAKLTRKGHAVGTPAFMSPEQAMGDPVDGRADLYSVAATMYLALTGRKPLEADNLADLMHALVLKNPEPVTKLRPDVDAAVAGVIERALGKRPGDRFGSALEMARALQPFTKSSPGPARTLESPLDPNLVHDTLPDPESRTAPLPHPPPVLPKAPSRRRLGANEEVAVAVVASSALVALGLVCAAFAVTRGRTTPAPARRSVGPAPTAVAPGDDTPAFPALAAPLPRSSADFPPLPDSPLPDPPPPDPSPPPDASRAAGAAEEPSVCKTARRARELHARLDVVSKLERMCRDQGGQP